MIDQLDFLLLVSFLAGEISAWASASKMKGREKEPGKRNGREREGDE